ncbi:putative methyltransferase [Salinisphaera sp. S4-8]|uniref:16S rRNA (guanine(966)-N(2))-methyltransferase RsmD n=1 Tax=Salinisphaera sp. S4-8 TaxID=633357 RepID=UPI0033413895
MARRARQRRPSAAPASTTVRIIGGQWRGRRLPVAVADGLRPTPDRVRETLFNWLAPRIEGARCVDLFAGTGALGLEALSRGAAHVQFVDRDRQAITALRTTLETLAAGERATLVQADALTLTLTAPAPDIVFIDPPFAAQLHAGALAAVIAQLRPNARIYLEYPAAQGDEILAMLADRAHVLRQKRAGQVGYCLAQPRAASEDDGASSIS